MYNYKTKHKQILNVKRRNSTMKKFISFVMAGAMVASLVPATAFAAKGEVTATAKVVDAKDLEKGETAVSGPELQIKIGSADYTAGTTPTLEVEVNLDNAEFKNYKPTDLYNLVKIAFDGTAKTVKPYGEGSTTYEYKELATWDDSKFAGIAKLDSSSKVDESTLVSASKFSAETIKGDDARTFLLGKGYTYSAVDGTFSIASATAPLKTLYTASKINSGIVTKTLEDVVADAIKTGGAYENYVMVEKTVVTTGSTSINPDTEIGIEVKDPDKDSVTYKFYGKFAKDDKISVALDTKMTKTSEGTKATVSVDSKAVTANDLVFASILGKGFKVSVKKTVDVATDEVVNLNSNGLKIEAAVGNLPSKVTLKISNGFEFTKANDKMSGSNYDIVREDEKELTVNVTGSVDEITVKDIQIEATTAKSGAVATITAKASNNDSASCEVAKVVDYKVNLSVDADEDIPVIYSGTDVGNAGLTDDSEHWSLEVTAKESFPGAWSMRQGFNFNLPEGVYVTDVKVTGADNFKVSTSTTASKDASRTDWEEAFKTAYQDGDHKNFEFKKRVFNDVDTVLAKDPAELTFELQLVADPTFEGDVKLAFEGALVDKQEVTIAKFVKPYTVKAEQNDVIIDYRNTEVKTPIVITEAEEGLWKKDATFKLNIEDDLLTFENDPTFTIDSDSDMTLKDDKADKGTIKFSVKEESDKAATITISDMKLFMSRSIPAGAYDLEIATTMSEAYDRQVLYAPDATTVASWKSGDRPSETTTKKDSYVDDVCDYSDVVKAAFINVVTSGRDNDNLFTTKVVVPVGEAYLLAGEAKVELDAPAYISAAGYTMLPVRAISKALGVNTNNVLWNAETRTVTVMYAQRIITMTVGQKTIYVNGSAIPASAAPEIKDGRTFLPLRDLGTALGVTNVNWDAATKTATLN